MNLIDQIVNDRSLTPFRDIIKLVAGGDTHFEGILKSEVQKLYDSKLNSKVAEDTARSWTKAIDSVLDIYNLSVEKRKLMADKLAANGAIQIVKVAELLANYPAYAEAVAKAKAADDATALGKARDNRKKAQDEIRKQLIIVGRLLNGDL